MAVRVSKDAFNIRDKLSELAVKFGLKGSELARAETVQDARDLVSAGRKNLVINGDMKVSQRYGDGYSSNLTSGGNFIVDRYRGYNTDGTARGVQSTVAPPGFTYSCKFDITAANTPRTASAFAGLYYTLEGYDASALKWSTPSEAKPCTVSFWVRASVPGIYTFAVRAATFAENYVAPYNINQADTWEYKTINVPPPPSGTFGVSNDIGFSLFWAIDLGGSAAGVTANTNAWGSGNKYGVSNMAHLFSADNNSFYLTGVQLEVGKNATEFEHRSYGEELALCQRYFFMLGDTNNTSLPHASYYRSDLVAMSVQFPVTMRTNPSLYITSGTDYFKIYANNTSDTFDSFVISREQPNCATLDASGTGASGTNGHSGPCAINNSLARLGFNAEL
jgi:hypothetical protein